MEDYRECIRCRNSDVEIRELWSSSDYGLWIIQCTTCGRFTPCKAISGLPWNELNTELEKAWNRFNGAIC